MGNLIRTAWVFIFTVLSTTLHSVLAVISGLMNPYSDFSNNNIRRWARSILWAAGIRVEVQGKELLHSGQSYIFMSNHQSAFDILACVVSIPGTVRFIAKKELFRIPFLAQGMRAAGMIAIDRGNSAKARETINKAVDIVRSGVSVIIYPEGTRSRDGNIHRFKKGGFVLAILGHIPIAPMVIYGSFNIMQKKSLKLGKGHIRIEFLKPITTQSYEMKDRNKLVQIVYEQITGRFDQLTKQKQSESDKNKEES